METLVQDRIELAPELQKETANSSKVSVIILRTKNNAYVGFERPWEIKLLGKSMEEWVSLSCDNYPITYVEYDGKSDVLEIAKNNIRSSEYTMVLYTDTPLIRKKTVDEILEYCFVKNMSVCKLTRGYVFRNDFLKNADRVYTAEPQYFDEEDFMTAYNLKQLMIIEDVLRGRILSFHMKNGVRIVDSGAVSIDADVTINNGTTIYPNNRIFGNTFVGEDCTLLPNNIIENSYIGKGSKIEYSVIKNAELPDYTIVGPFEKIIKK